MLGPSAWSVADRELMAAYVSKVKVRVLHRRTHRDRGAGVPGSREGSGGAGPGGKAADTEDMREVLSAGVSHQQVEDALEVCAAFNTTDRLADAFGFELLSPEGFKAGVKYLLKRGYR